MVAVADEERLGTGCETGGVSLTFVVTGVPSASARETGDPPPSVQLLRGRGPLPALPQGVQGPGIETLSGGGQHSPVVFVLCLESGVIAVFSTRAHQVSCGVCKHSAPAIDSWRRHGQKVKVGGGVKMNCPACLLLRPLPPGWQVARCWSPGAGKWCGAGHFLVHSGRALPREYWPAAPRVQWWARH